MGSHTCAGGLCVPRGRVRWAAGGTTQLLSVPPNWLQDSGAYAAATVTGKLTPSPSTAPSPGGKYDKHRLPGRHPPECPSFTRRHSQGAPHTGTINGAFAPCKWLKEGTVTSRHDPEGTPPSPCGIKACSDCNLSWEAPCLHPTPASYPCTHLCSHPCILPLHPTPASYPCSHPCLPPLHSPLQSSLHPTPASFLCTHPCTPLLHSHPTQCPPTTGYPPGPWQSPWGPLGEGGA